MQSATSLLNSSHKLPAQSANAQAKSWRLIEAIHTSKPATDYLDHLESEIEINQAVNENGQYRPNSKGKVTHV